MVQTSAVVMSFWRRASTSYSVRPSFCITMKDWRWCFFWYVGGRVACFNTTELLTLIGS